MPTFEQHISISQVDKNGWARLVRTLPEGHALGFVEKSCSHNGHEICLLLADGERYSVRLELHDLIMRAATLVVPRDCELTNNLRSQALKMEERFWVPFISLLRNVEVLHLCTSTETHCLNYGWGQPESISLAYYTSIQNYMLASGLDLARTPEDYVSRRPFCAIHYAGSEEDRNFIPGVEQEELFLKSRLSADQIEIGPRTPRQFLDEPALVNRWHFGGHIARDPQCRSSAMLVERGEFLSPWDLQSGRTRIEHGFLNGCGAARVEECITGDRISLVGPLLNKGARSVVASILPMTDPMAVEISREWYSDPATFDPEPALGDVMRLRRTQWTAVRNNRLRKQVSWIIKSKAIADDNRLRAASKKIFLSQGVMTDLCNFTHNETALAQNMIKTNENNPDDFNALLSSVAQFSSIVRLSSSPLPLSCLYDDELAEIGGRRVYVGRH